MSGYHLATPEIQDFYWKIKEFIKKDIQIRIEYNTFSIFLNDEVLLNKIIKKIPTYIKYVYIPYDDNEKDFILTNGRHKTICEQYPHKKYQFKVTFNDKFQRIDKKEFLQWLEKNDKENFKFTKTTMLFLEEKSKYNYVYNPTAYVLNEKLLSYLSLYLSSYIQKIEEFVLRESINSSAKE